MKKIFLLFMVAGLVSCGGSDFTNSETSPDVNVPDASDAAADVDVESSVETSVPDVVDVPDVTETSTKDVVESSTEDVVESSVEDTSGCVPGELSCQGKTPVFCNGNGELQTKPECEYLCEDGICTGECNPGDERCLDRDVEFCDSSGTWQVTSICPIQCQQNICNGTWCCEELSSGACMCTVNQVCNSATGELTSCDGTYLCCYHSEQSGTKCNCLATTSMTDCQYTVDILVSMGHPAHVVDSCPE